MDANPGLGCIYLVYRAFMVEICTKKTPSFNISKKKGVDQKIQKKLELKL